MPKRKTRFDSKAETAGDRTSAAGLSGAAHAGVTGAGHGSPCNRVHPAEECEGAGPTQETPLREAARTDHLPGDIGWLLVMGGLVGVVAPGVLGLDMVALGALILWPGNRRRLNRWLVCHHTAPRILRGSMKQVGRFLADLENRYPRRRS